MGGRLCHDIDSKRACMLFNRGQIFDPCRIAQQGVELRGPMIAVSAAGRCGMQRHHIRRGPSEQCVIAPRDFAEQMGKTISGADAFFTAGTYAMIYDYQVTKLGLEPKEAHKEAERLTEQVAQPTRAATRSLVENTTQSNPLTKLAWAFSSEVRQKIMLAAYKGFTGRTLSEKARAVAVTWGFGGAVAAVIRAMVADLRDDDDEETFDEKHWNASRLTAQTLAGPFQGIAVIGEGIESGIFTAFRAAGLKPGYLGDGNILETPERGFQALTSLGEYESTEKVFKDIDAIITGAAPFNDSAAAYSSFSHFARDVFNVTKNAIGD